MNNDLKNLQKEGVLAELEHDSKTQSVQPLAVSQVPPTRSEVSIRVFMFYRRWPKQEGILGMPFVIVYFPFSAV
jgi:hypothetical protein